jgi:hypothetical protein
MLTGHASVALQRMKEQQQKHNQQHVAQMNSDAAVVVDGGGDINGAKEEIITSVMYVNKDVAQKENDDEDSGVPVLIPTIDNDNYD